MDEVSIDSESQGKSQWKSVRRKQRSGSPVEGQVLRCTSHKSYFLQDRSNTRLRDHEREELRSGGIKSPGYPEEEEDPIFEEDFPKDLNKEKKIWTGTLQLVTSILISAALFFTLKISTLRDKKIWKLLLWQWEATALILVLGRLVTRWVFKMIVFFMQRSFWLRKRFLYFIYEMKDGIHNALWLVLVLLVWHNLFRDNLERDTKSRLLRNVTKVLACVVVSLILWLAKTLMMKYLISKFYMTTYLDKVLDSFLNRYVIAALSNSASKNGDKADHEISIDLLHQLNPKNVSTWTVKRMMNIIQHGALFTLDEQSTDKVESMEEKIAEKIFQNAAKPGSKYIKLADIERFIRKDEALKAMSLIEGAPDINRISESTLKRWVVQAFSDWESLGSTLNDMGTIIDEIYLPVNVLFIISMQMCFLFVIGILSGEFFKFLGIVWAQFLTLSFAFGSTLNSIFEAAFFLLVIHPFDVGDLCEIDNVQLKVETINISNTIFRKFDSNQQSTIPNKVLAAKTIDNFNRSPHMKDKVEFCIHKNTSADNILTMERRISSYINNNKQYWYPEPTIICKDIEDLDRLKFQVLLKHKMNDQDKDERRRRRGNLVKEIAKITSELKTNKAS